MIKSYTDLEQSKKLAEILPLESADMHYPDYYFDGNAKGPCNTPYKEAIEDLLHVYINPKTKRLLPCWSLAALLKVIPKKIKDFNVLRIDINEKDFSIWYDEIGIGVNTELPDITMECPVDACVNMIEKLHDLNLL